MRANLLDTKVRTRCIGVEEREVKKKEWNNKKKRKNSNDKFHRILDPVTGENALCIRLFLDARDTKYLEDISPVNKPREIE